CTSSYTQPSPTHIYTLSLHNPLPISPLRRGSASLSNAAGVVAVPRPRSEHRAARRATARALGCVRAARAAAQHAGRVGAREAPRSEEHTSELQSRFDLVCRLLLEKKK